MSNLEVTFHLIGGESVNQSYVTQEQVAEPREELKDADGVIEFYSTYTMGRVAIPVRSITHIDVKATK